MSGASVSELVERAFDYRGYVTVTRRDGSKVVGFVYDRSTDHLELFDEHASCRLRLAISEIENIELTGEDAAAKAHRIWERRQGSLEPRETSAWGDEENVRPTLILVALPAELRAVAHALDAKVRGSIVRGRLGANRVVAIAVGMGGGATHAITEERPRFVISCGFSGALDPSLAPGDLVLGSSVRDETGESVFAPEHVLRVARRALHGPQRVAEGEILCATRVAATRDEKRGLGRPGRLALDLESWPVARAAQRAGLPWLVLRVVLDPLDTDLPPFTRELHTSYLVPALRHALTGPRAALQLARLGLEARTASRALARGLRRLAPVITPTEERRVRP